MYWKYRLPDQEPDDHEENDSTDVDHPDPE